MEGQLADDTLEILPDDLKDDDIHPLRIEDQNCPGVKGDIFSDLHFKTNTIRCQVLKTFGFPFHIFESGNTHLLFWSFELVAFSYDTNGREEWQATVSSVVGI